jgi:signal transduction histidine kinase
VTYNSISNLHHKAEHDLCTAVLLVDASGVVRSADACAETLFRASPQEVLGHPLSELFPDSELQGALQAVTQGAPLVKRMVRLEAPPRQLFVTVSALSPGNTPGSTTAGGALYAVLFASADDYQAESESKAALQFRGTIEAVISGFAHEVRNPIAAVLSISEAALCSLPANTSAHGMLSRIPALVNRVDKLIKEALHYSKPRAPRRSPYPLRSLVAWSLDLAQVKRSRVEIDGSIEQQSGAVLVDAEQIEQVLVNLLCNAAQVTRTSIKIVASRVDESPRVMRSQGPAVVIDVIDDGGGVADENRSRIFEPFFTTKANGTGLGLAIARDLARLNGGDLMLYSTSERGSTFRLYLEASAGQALEATGT